jgi:hypothetical protein
VVLLDLLSDSVVYLGLTVGESMGKNIADLDLKLMALFGPGKVCCKCMHITKAISK